MQMRGEVSILLLGCMLLMTWERLSHDVSDCAITSDCAS